MSPLSLVWIASRTSSCSTHRSPLPPFPNSFHFVKANAARVNIGSAGYGTTSHMASELLKLMTSVSFVHVPYRGGALAVSDLLGGQIQAMFVTLPGAIEYINKRRQAARVSGDYRRTLRGISCPADDGRICSGHRDQRIVWHSCTAA